jgi:hypothetical protein
MGAISIPYVKCHKQVHVDLHFDVNGTMLGVDFAGGRNLAEAGQKEMTYREHLEIKYPIYDEFRAKKKEELSQIFDKMKVIDHPELSKYSKVYETALGKLQNLKEENSHVFPSVFRLLEELQKNNIEPTFLIRTYGSEAAQAAEEVSQKFPNIRFEDPIDLRERGIEFPIHSLHGKGHQVISDHYPIWDDNGKKREYGKAFPVYNDPCEKSLFFDDNIEIKGEYETHNIVNPYDPKTGLSIPIDGLLGRSIFRVDTIEAILNDEYYVELFNKAMAAQE